MNNIVEIDVSDRENWNNTVKSFPQYDVFYLNEYVTAFMNEDSENGVPILLYYQNGNNRAINVVFKRDVANNLYFKNKFEMNQYYDLISPYGYGGFMGTVTDYQTLNQQYAEYCLAHHYICEFVRFELFSEYYSHYDGEVETRTHNVIRNLEMPLDDLWMDFKQKVRKNVKKANSYGLEIVLDNKGDYLEDFLRIYYGTMERTEAKEGFFFSRQFFETLMSMENHVMMFHVLYEGKIVSTELVIYGSENCYSYLGGTDRNYFDVRPNDYLKYEIIKWAKEKGLKNFVLGGGYGSDDGIYQYKTSLAPKGIVDFYIGRRIFDLNTYKYLVDIREDNVSARQNPVFFPEYRA
ncbi:lipid II:glycine glycyltransferase FemX [Enterocloster aldenensis]|uniref:lipid II:glycine glycyltransferase FemX n=1 Tax=Enterocloster aldenensis TaxID=358742 RepID=UPI00402801C4